MTGTSDTENVNYSTGNVSISIPLLQLPGLNGPGFSLSLNYNSKLWDMQTSFNPYQGVIESNGLPSGTYSMAWQRLSQSDFAGGRLSIPHLVFTNQFVGQTLAVSPNSSSPVGTWANVNWMYVDEQGAQHPFLVARDLAFAPPGGDLSPPTISQIDVSDSVDGSDLTLNTQTPSDITVTRPDGVVIHFDASGVVGVAGTGGGSFDYTPTKIVDVHGNTTTFSGLSVITDPLGRQVTLGTNTITYGSSSNPTTITYSSSPITVPDVTLHATGCQLPNSPSDLSVDFGISGSLVSISIATGQGTRVYQIGLDAVGEPISVNYPAGGYAQYAYTPFSQAYLGSSSNTTYCSAIDYRQVTQKSVCRSASGTCTHPEITTYTPTYPQGITNQFNTSETVTYPPDSRGIAKSEIFTFVAAGAYIAANNRSSYPSAILTDDSVYDSTTLIKDTKPSYASASGSYYYCPSVSSGQTETFGSVSRQTSITPDTRTISFHYESPSNTVSIACPSSRPAITQQYGYNGSLFETITDTWDKTDSFVSALHVLDHLSSEVIADGSGNTIRTTGYTYYPTSDLKSSSVSGLNVSGSPTTSYIVNALGQVTQITDAKGNITGLGYSSPYSDTTCSTTPGTSPGPSQNTNALNQVSKLQYYSCSGLLQSTTDPNGNTTAYTYDLINRPLSISYPDNGKANITTTDTAPIVQTTTALRDANGDLLTSSQTEDGIGETVKQVSAAGQIIDLTYDPFGKLATVSNPHGPTASSTDGTTTYYYDALGRTVFTVQQEQSSKSWCYDGVQVYSRQINCSSEMGAIKTGSWVDTTDELGRHKQLSYDSRGNLVKLLEPNPTQPISSAPAIETDYQYDALSNLVRVDQWGGPSGSSGDRVRTFTYDALSRLLSSSNPETGTVNYGYDANGNLISKTDARGVTINYAYDALNRMLSKTYANDSTGTASACYQYDQSSVSGAGANLVGHVTSAWTQVGSCAATPPIPGALTLRSFLAYDPMGRMLSEQQCSKSNCTTGTPYSPAYTYDLSGNIGTHSNGISTMMFTNGYDAAGHLSTVTSSNTQYPTSLFASPSYSPAGGLTGATFGTGLVLGRTYDSRLRVTGEVDTGTGTAAATPGTATITVVGSQQTQ